MIDVKITREPGAQLPEYHTAGAAGADLAAFLKEPVVIAPGEICLVPTGIRIELPAGYEAQIRPRSGLALKHGITLPNSPGTIDEDYRGEVKVILSNTGRNEFTVENGMRIAQMVFSKVERGSFSETGGLSGTERNEGGFGHSGVK
jgi:dUTP pyrophosphatase